MWLFTQHICQASTLSSCGNIKMSKMKFFCLPEKISINLKNQIYIIQEVSNSILYKFHHKYKETTSELSFFPQPSMSRLLPAEHFQQSKGKKLKAHFFKKPKWKCWVPGLVYCDRQFRLNFLQSWSNPGYPQQLGDSTWPTPAIR